MDALILMTRVPIPGTTKTRLMGDLSGEECALLHRAFLKDIFNIMDSVKHSVDIYVTYTPTDSVGLIKDIVPVYSKTYPQIGNNLGDKMCNAMEVLFKKGYEKVVLMGSDVPSIQKKDLSLAFDLLDKNDMVLGPTFDGGYYLIGMKKLHSEVFKNNLSWGNMTVLEKTIDIGENSNLSIGLARRIRDIDTIEDLLDFIDNYNNYNTIPQNTVDFIQNNLKNR